MLGFGKKKNKAADAEGAIAPEEAAKDAEEAVGTAPAAAEETEQAAEAGETAGTGPADRAENGPFDASETEVDEETMVDLGGLKVPQVQDVDLRLEVDEQTQQVVAVTYQKGDALLQMQAFAAPKSRGLWSEVRTEIAQSVREQEGAVEFVDGELGRMVVARIPAALPNGGRGFRVARFVGVDGPRWFLRGVFSGDAATKEDAAREMEAVLRAVVVDRGREPMAPRDLLPLRVPQNAVRGDSAPTPADAGLEVPERGPEIAEIR